MKIALTHTRYSYTGGVEKYIYSLLEYLLAAGHEVHYLAARWEPREHPRLTFHRVPMLRYPPSLRVLSFNWFVNRILERENFDIVHGFTKTDRQDVYTDGSGCLEEFIEVTRAHQPRWQRALHRATPHQLAILWMERRRFQPEAIRRIIPMANFVRDQILHRYPVRPERIEVVYNGVDTEHFHPRNRRLIGDAFRARHGIPAGRRVLLFVGNDWFRKGLDTLLRAYTGIRRDAIARGAPPPLLLVCGSDNHADRFRQSPEAREADTDIRWLGPTREIRDPFAASDLFLFPSRYDVFGNVGLEALACGVPCVLSRRAGVSEVLDGELPGRILENPLDAEELKRQTWDLLAEGGPSEARREAARAIAERYSWEKHFARILAIYEEVLAEKLGARTAPREHAAHG